MIEFILGSFLYAKYKKKYKLKPILKHWSIYPVLLFALFYIFLEVTMWLEWYYFVPYQQLIKQATLFSYIPLVITYKLYENDKYKDNDFLCIITSPMVIAILCLWLGSTLNGIAMAANGGYMPVFPSLSILTGYIKPSFFEKGIHILGNADTNLKFLTDWIDLGYSVLSPADLLIRLYAFIILYFSIKRSNKMQKY